MKWSTTRVARKRRRCERCGGWIFAGDRYKELRVSPNDNDVGNTEWWRAAECAGCVLGPDA